MNLSLQGVLMIIFYRVTGQTEPLWTFTIVTTDANSDFNWLHDRQPVILSTTEALTTWLDTSSQTWNSKLSEIVKPYHDSSSPLEWFVSLPHLLSFIILALHVPLLRTPEIHHLTYEIVTSFRKKSVK